MKRTIESVNDNLPKQKSPQMWPLSKYHDAIKWWNGPAYGTGHFNDELYKKIVEIKSN